MKLQSRPLRILLHSGGWTTNIGNAFLQMGAEALLQSAAPSAQIYFSSALPRWFLAERVVGHPRPNPELAPDTIAYGDYDVFVSAGMVLCREFTDILGDALRTAAAAGKCVLFLGAGAAEYTQDERRAFVSGMRDVPVLGLRSRDYNSFELFRSDFANSTAGIDCAWWLPEAYEPLSLNLGEYRVASFHDEPEPEALAGAPEVIRAYHFSFERIGAQYVNAGRSLVSDRPEDYLNLYASAAEVHTDRVHATVASLVYGRVCRLYTQTPRAALFAAAGAGDVTKQLYRLPEGVLAEKKERQVEWVRLVLERAFPGRL